jgi:hypothetical protein
MGHGLWGFVGIGVVDEGAKLVHGLRGFGKEFGASLGEHHELGEITEGGGATGGDALGGKSVEDHVESALNALFGKSFSFQVRQVLRQIVFALDGAAFDGGVSAAIAFERIESRKTTEAAIGELKLAEVEGIILALDSHGESIAKNTELSIHGIGTTWTNLGNGTRKIFRMTDQPRTRSLNCEWGYVTDNEDG